MKKRVFAAVLAACILTMTACSPTQETIDSSDLEEETTTEVTEDDSDITESETDETQEDETQEDVIPDIPVAPQQLPETVDVGSYIEFGYYEQDNDLSNGREAIEWLVLAVDGNKALLISRNALDWQPYNSDANEFTWETCTLRNWLNTSFINEAFSGEQQNIIVNTTNVNENDNPFYESLGGNDTTDQVFLLSINEAEYLYFDSSEARVCMPTQYANARYVEASGGSTNIEECLWWLRSPGIDNYRAAIVSKTGMFNYYGREANFVRFPIYIRPAMWIELQ